MIVIVLAVGGFVVFAGTFRDPPERQVADEDYLATVSDLQEAGASVVYPADLPEGWQATEVRFDPGERPAFELNLFTDDDEFVGLRQVDDDVDDLLDKAGVDDVSEGDPLTGVDGVAATWDAWTDPDGDRAYSALVGDETVLVYGRVSAERLADVVGRLTTDPVADAASPSGSPSA
jgi:hypothetical protein